MEAAEVESLIDEIMAPFFANFRTIVPGKVVSVVGNLATIQIAIQDLDSSGDPITGVITLPSVPVMMMGGALNSITCQVAAGDFGLLLVCDRDVTGFKLNKAVSPVSSYGMANLQYSIFLPGLFLPGHDGVKISSTTSVLIEVGDTQATITPNQINLSAGGATVQIASGVVTITGDLTIAGTIAADNITVGGIGFLAHRHPVTTAPGTTGIPV